MALGNLIPWGPNPGMATGGHSAPFLALRRDMERLSDDTLHGLNAPSPAGASDWPSIGVGETEAEYKVTACCEMRAMTATPQLCCH
jgi:hypothetical protein